MKKWLKRIRGAVGMGLTWAAAWAPIGAIFGLLNVAMGTPFFGGGLGLVVVGSLGYAAFGFLAGAAFSVVLRVAEGRSKFDQMSLPRFASWGAVGGGFFSIAYMVTVGVGPPLALVTAFVVFLTLMGAGSAAGSLTLARRADDRELLEHGADVADIGLTEEEKRELLAG